MPKSNIDDAAVVERLPVARVRVAERDAVLAGGGVVEAVHDLGDAVALGASSAFLRSSKRSPSWQLGDEHAPRGELEVDIRDQDVRVVAPQALTRRWWRLELVVELLGDPLAQLVAERLACRGPARCAPAAAAAPEVAQVGVDGLGDAGVLDLDRDRRAVARGRAVHLPDGGGRHRLRLDVGQDPRDRLAPLLGHQLLELRPRRRSARCRAARRGGAGCARRPRPPSPGTRWWR